MTISSLPLPSVTTQTTRLQSLSSSSSIAAVSPSATAGAAAAANVSALSFDAMVRQVVTSNNRAAAIHFAAARSHGSDETSLDAAIGELSTALKMLSSHMRMTKTKNQPQHAQQEQAKQQQQQHHQQSVQLSFGMPPASTSTSASTSTYFVTGPSRNSTAASTSTAVAEEPLHQVFHLPLFLDLTSNFKRQCHATATAVATTTAADDSTSTVVEAGTLESLSCAIIYNLGLAWHLKALTAATMKKNNTQQDGTLMYNKALAMYQHSYRLWTQTSTSTTTACMSMGSQDPLPYLAMVSNITCIYQALLLESSSQAHSLRRLQSWVSSLEMYSSALLSALVLCVDAEYTCLHWKEVLMDGFLYNALSPLTTTSSLLSDDSNATIESTQWSCTFLTNLAPAA